MTMDIGPLSIKVLRELCGDSRISLTEMSKRLKTPTYVLSRHIQKLEDGLSLRYTIEMDQAKLGLAKTNILYFKFSKPVSSEAITALIGNSNMVQLALMTKGKNFDLVLFIIPRNTEDYAKWELALTLKFSDYGVMVSRSYVDILHLGFIPLNDWAIESSDLKKAYKDILIELNRDSRQTIKSLSEKIGMKEDIVRYYMLKMKEEGLIKRFTAIAAKPTYDVNIILFVDYIFRRGFVKRTFQKRRTVYLKQQEPSPPYNEYQMVGTLSGAEYDLVWGLYRTEKEAVEGCIQVHKSIFAADSPLIKFGYVSKVVKGAIPIRNIDIKNNYVTTEWVEE